MSITKNKNRNIQITIGCLKWGLMGGDHGLCKEFRWPPRWWVNMSSWWDTWLQGTNRGLEEAEDGQEERWQWQSHHLNNIQALKAACQEGYRKTAAATSTVTGAVGAMGRAGSGEGSDGLTASKLFFSQSGGDCADEEQLLCRSGELLRGRSMSKRTKAVLQGFSFGERDRNIYKKSN